MAGVVRPVREQPWTFGIALYREGGEQISQSRVTPDWEPATEWLRLTALRRAVGQENVFTLGSEFEPVWDQVLGAPYVEGFRGTLLAPGPHDDVSHVFPLTYLTEEADRVSRQLVEAGELTEGDSFTYRGLAFHGAGVPVGGGAVSGAEAGREAVGANPVGVPTTRRFTSKALAPGVPVREGTLTARTAGAEVVGTADPLDIPVLIPDAVFAQAAERATDAGARETGGVLIGHLRQDLEEPEAFVEVTAQVPALGAEADSSRLSFTPAVWSAVQAAIDLRRRDEIMVGWWHSHPVHEWCKDCTPDRQRECPLRGDFLSAHDRLLHQTVFPRAYSTALVLNELGDAGRTFSLFGSHHGRLEPRGYHRLTEDQETGSS